MKCTIIGNIPHGRTGTRQVDYRLRLRQEPAAALAALWNDRTDGSPFAVRPARGTT